MSQKTVWVSDTDLNGLESVARITKMDGSYYLEVTSQNKTSLVSKLKQIWKVLTGKMTVFSFVILSDKDTWVRRIEDGGKDC